MKMDMKGFEMQSIASWSREGKNGLEKFWQNCQNDRYFSKNAKIRSISL